MRQPADVDAGVLATDVRQLIEESRRQVAQVVNAGLTTLYWQIGDRVRRDVLGEERAAYGAEIVSALGRQLEAEFGRGFGSRNLFRMIRFAEVFPDWEIVSALRSQLGWTHFRQIIPMDDPLERDFYAEMCRIERWSTRTLQQKIDGMRSSAPASRSSSGRSASPSTGTPSSSAPARSGRPSRSSTSAAAGSTWPST